MDLNVNHSSHIQAGTETYFTSRHMENQTSSKATNILKRYLMQLLLYLNIS